jgi:glucose/arabinose dehydrogenase
MIDRRWAWLFIGFVVLGLNGSAQQPSTPTPIGIPVTALGDGPWVFDTAEQHKIRVVVVAKGLSHPWSLAFLPDGNLLVTERVGRLRLIRDGVLHPYPWQDSPKSRPFASAD